MSAISANERNRRYGAGLKNIVRRERYVDDTVRYQLPSFLLPACGTTEQFWAKSVHDLSLLILRKWHP